MRISRRRTIALSSALAVAGLSEPLAAADYPSKPIRMVVSYPPGGGVDVMARVLAAALGERLKETVIVENKPGASGMIGTEYVAKASPDGYTLMLAPADTHSINPNVYRSIRYDARQDFEPVALLGNLPMTLVVNPSLPVKTVAEFVKYVKERPGKVTFASWGIGSSSHVAMETLILDSKLDMLHVPFTGAAPAINALIAGQIDAMMVTLPTSEAYDQSGKIRIIGVTSIQRPPGSPTYPTAGMPTHLLAWVGVLAPARTPPAIVDRLNREIKALMADPPVRAGLVKAGLEPVGEVESPTAFGRFLATQYDLWGKTVREANISVELK
jgi:tripartite-type tricarboxylate transporter receptor subunit TctC